MIISVASGKGGTGKTFVATNLAVSLKKDVHLLDCDVEEPNSNLFLNPVIDKTESVIALVPRIDLEKCSFCKKCMDICRYGAIAVLKKNVMIFENLCHSCGGCFAVCPEDALIEKQRVLGTIEHGTIEHQIRSHISFTHGRMDIGQVMVPPIIKKVRTFTRQDRITIIDAPPGTSCPVIAAVKGAHFVLLVTEPTPFGLHDLKLAVETIKILGIPHGLIINRAGLGNDDVKLYALKQNIPILMKIPFDRKIAQIYSKGQLVAETLPGYKEKFQDLYDKIIQLMENRGKNK